MNRKLLFILAFLGTWAGAAKAQYALSVLAPSAQAGVVSNTVIPDDTWGFGPVSQVAPVRGFCQWASPDTLALTPDINALGDLRGKIAVVRRGTVLRSWKALRCQRAGAIGVIIVNNDAAAPATLASEDSGGSVTIPVVLVPKAWGNANAQIIGSGQMEVLLGNLTGYYANNLSIARNSLYIPRAFAMPGSLVVDTGDFKFRVGGSVNNLGSRDQGSSVFKAVVRRVSPNPAVIYSDSAVLSAVSRTDSLDRVLRTYDHAAAEPGIADRRGHYQLEYTVYAQGVTDDNPTDNVVTYDFYMTDNSYSKSRLNMNPTPQATFLQPISAVAYTKAGGGAVIWGHYFRTPRQLPAGKDLYATQMTFAVTTNNAAATDSLGGESVSLEVRQWDDQNGDGAMDADEVSDPLATGSHSFVSNSDRGKFFTEPLQNSVNGNDGVRLEPDTRYLFLVNYSGSKTLFIQADEGTLDYTRNFADSTTTDWHIPLFNGTRWGFFKQSIQTAIRTDMDLITAVKPLSQGTLRVSPNPAQDRVRVGFDKLVKGAVQVRLRDLAGRVVYSVAVSDASSLPALEIGHLPSGIYQVEAQTETILHSAKLAVSR